MTDIPDLTDIDTWDDDALDALRVAVLTEQERRHVLATAPDMITQINERVLQATGRATGQPWRQPTGAHDAYPLGHTVEHEGRLYESLVDGNVWPPTSEQWRDLGEGEAEEAPPAPDWVPGTAYKRGDRITYQGAVYVVAQDHTSAAHWTPDAVASLYTRD